MKFAANLNLKEHQFFLLTLYNKSKDIADSFDSSKTKGKIAENCVNNLDKLCKQFR